MHVHLPWTLQLKVFAVICREWLHKSEFSKCKQPNMCGIHPNKRESAPSALLPTANTTNKNYVPFASQVRGGTFTNRRVLKIATLKKAHPTQQVIQQKPETDPPEQYSWNTQKYSSAEIHPWGKFNLHPLHHRIAASVGHCGHYMIWSRVVKITLSWSKISHTCAFFYINRAK